MAASRRQSFISFLAALFLHLALGAALLVVRQDDATRPTIEFTNVSSSAVRLELRKPSTKPENVAPARAGSRKKLGGSGRTVSSRSNRPDGIRYEGLFPDSAEALEQLQDGPGQGGTGMKELIDAGLRVPVEELNGAVRIPLILRQKSQGAKAVATVRGGLKSFIVLESIDGDQLLRAVLFDSLNSDSGRKFFAEWFSVAKENSLTIVLRQSTQIVPENTADFSEEIHWNGRQLILTQHLATRVGGPRSGGIPLPDFEAERGNRRDRIALQRLHLSPAYVSPLRERRLF